LAKKALSIDTHDGGANYYYGLASLELGDVVNAKDGFTLASLSVPFRSAAYTELGKLYLTEKNFGRSLEYASKALDFNRYNMTAYQLQAICYRYLKETSKANNVLNIITSMDPLSAFVKTEKYFSTDGFGKSIKNLFQNELPHESYMELANEYISKGLLEEGEQVLIASPESPIAYYWLAWIQNQRKINYQQSLQKANELSPLLVFPFRSETVQVLQWASEQTDSWKPDYYLGLILKEKNRVAESVKLFMELKNAPDYAPFYAARAELMQNDSVQAELDLKKAIQMDKEEWRYHKLLATHYINARKNENALSVASAYYRNHPENYVMGMLYAKTLLLNKRYKECDALLSKLNIIPFEGATEGRELYRETKLFLAMQEMNMKNYKKALQRINQSKIWPENLGVGKPYEEDIDTRLEDWLTYLSYQQLKNTAESQKALNKILQFVPKVENGIDKFLPANHLVTAWAMERSGQAKEANEWLEAQIKKFPNNKTIVWARDIFNNNPSTSTNQDDATTRLLMHVISMKEMKD
jgi:tetratricopeptide (TPR) repeat protein